MGSKKQVVDETGGNQVERDKQSIIEALRKTILDPKASVLDKTRAAETLGRLSDYSPFSRPQDPAPQENVIDQHTAQHIAFLPCAKLFGRWLRLGTKNRNNFVHNGQNVSE